MCSSDLMAAQHHAQHIQETGGHDAVGVHKFIQHVQHRQAGGGAEQQHGSRHHRHAHRQRGGHAAGFQLVLHCRNHYFQHGNQRSEPGEHQRAEKQQADQRAGRRLVDDGGKRDKGQADATGGRTAIIKLLRLYGVREIIAVDSRGIIGDSRTDLNDEKKALLEFVDRSKAGTMEDAIAGADIFIGVPCVVSEG